MDFIKKIEILRLHADQFSTYIRKNHPKTSSDEIKILKEIYPFMPADYEAFLNHFDHIWISWCTFLGSDNWEVASRSALKELWYETIGENFIPIAVDAVGDLFTLNKQGQVIMFDVDEFEGQQHFIANNFTEFMEDCVLGKRYSEFSNPEDDSFYDFLKSQGWA